MVRPSIVLLGGTALVLAGLASPARAQESVCGASPTLGRGETLEDVAQRCDVTLQGLREANPNLTGADIAPGARLNMPGGRNLLDRAGDLLRDASEQIEGAARETGQSVSDYLTRNPDLGKNIYDFGARVGLPGFNPSDRPAATGTASVAVTPAVPVPGTEITISAAGLRPGAAAEIGIGRTAREYTVVGNATADASGRISTEVLLPDWAEGGGQVVVVVETPNVQVRSDPIEVAATE